MMRKTRFSGVPLAFAAALLVMQGACDAKGEKMRADNTAVKAISGVDEFKKVVDSSGDRLLLFDLYADWCLPCRVLSPMLEEIAKEHKDKVTVYKVDIAKHQDIAVGLGVTGIPYVVFVKNKTGAHAMTGVQPKQAYVRAINILVDADIKKPADTPDGNIVDGVRVIRLSTATTPGNIYVYRGETVKLIVEKVGFPYSIHIPHYKISQEAVVGKDLVVEFKAKDIGVFHMFCNGKCPSGDDARYGQIIVMQYEAGDKFKEIPHGEGEAARSRRAHTQRVPPWSYQGCEAHSCSTVGEPVA
jgi:thioredoxin 1